ncbi:MAG TPA: hypothetical protein VFF73_08200 [Planctomycetota bacterium]|nr:hypothetical protein [Planctomycetota bacterium]
MRPLLAVARVTVAEAVRSRVVAGLVVGLAGALLLLAAQSTGDGTEIGKARAFVAGALDATWALLALAAAFLATASLSRELEDGRAVPINVTPAPRAAFLAGKCLGLVLVLGLVLALALAWTFGVVLVRERSYSPEARARIDGELLAARAQLLPPRLDATDKGVIARATDRFVAAQKEGLTEGMSPEKALKKLVDDELVKALSVGHGREVSWSFEPIFPVPEADQVTVRFKYRTTEPLIPGKGPRGIFSLWIAGVKQVEWPVTSAPNTHHELTIPGHVLAAPELKARSEGKVTRAHDTTLEIDGNPVPLPEDFSLGVREGDLVSQGQTVARASRVRMKVTYQNLDEGITVVFPPEGVSILYVDRPLGLNVLAAFALIVGRLVFVVACGLALSTFLDGRVAALATFFVLAVAASHGFLDDAVGPILSSADDNVFGILDVPVKAILRGVLFLLPDLGKLDPSEALAEGRCVEGAFTTLVSLALAAGGGAIGLGSLVLSRRELPS